jgi:hypothetical protein
VTIDSGGKVGERTTPAGVASRTTGAAAALLFSGTARVRLVLRWNREVGPECAAAVANCRPASERGRKYRENYRA